MLQIFVMAMLLSYIGDPEEALGFGKEIMNLVLKIW